MIKRTEKKQAQGKRLDRWIQDSMHISGKEAKRLLDSGAVRVNGRKVVIAKWMVSSRDAVKVSPAQGRPERGSGGGGGGSGGVSGGFVRVIKETKDIIAVEKPIGMEVISNDRSRKTVIDMVRGYLERKFKGAGGTFVKAVHRLDKETSGVLLFAKSNAGARLIDMFKAGKVSKTYVAVVEGALPRSDGKIDLPIEKGDFGHGQKVAISDDDEGVRALTQYHVIERYKNATLINAYPSTGRTHQIRIHFAAIGYPLVGDKIYNKDRRIKFPRQALHALKIGFKSTILGNFEASSPMPRDIAALIDHLRENS